MEPLEIKLKITIRTLNNTYRLVVGDNILMKLEDYERAIGGNLIERN